MRVVSAIVIILGLAVLVFGIVFLPRASSAEQEVADSLTPPVTLDTLDLTYENIDMQVDNMMGNEPQYVMLFAQRTSLGLARANVGTASMVRMLGIVNIIAGLGVMMAGFVLLRKSSEA